MHRCRRVQSKQLLGGHRAGECTDAENLIPTSPPWSLQGDHDAIAIGRYFTSNSDVVERLRLGQPLTRYGQLARIRGM